MIYIGLDITTFMYIYLDHPNQTEHWHQFARDCTSACAFCLDWVEFIYAFLKFCQCNGGKLHCISAHEASPTENTPRPFDAPKLGLFMEALQSNSCKFWSFSLAMVCLEVFDRLSQDWSEIVILVCQRSPLRTLSCCHLGIYRQLDISHQRNGDAGFLLHAICHCGEPVLDPGESCMEELLLGENFGRHTAR